MCTIKSLQCHSALKWNLSNGFGRLIGSCKEQQRIAKQACVEMGLVVFFLWNKIPIFDACDKQGNMLHTTENFEVLINHRLKITWCIMFNRYPLLMLCTWQKNMRSSEYLVKTTKLQRRWENNYTEMVTVICGILVKK